jgi:hypothetical protein
MCDACCVMSVIKILSVSQMRDNGGKDSNASHFSRNPSLSRLLRLSSTMMRYSCSSLRWRLPQAFVSERVVTLVRQSSNSTRMVSKAAGADKGTSFQVVGLSTMVGCLPSCVFGLEHSQNRPKPLVRSKPS